MKRLLTLIVVSASTLYGSTSPLCNKTCIECLYVLPEVRTSALSLKEEYLSTEKEISKSYRDEIVALLKKRNKLKITLEAITQKFRILDIETVVTIREIKKEAISMKKIKTHGEIK
ncbi:MAG TPA: hypothetical protein EYH42_09385 [Sulfurovum sp.]|nr:hypothetical protein [Sulfurovum sp.]